MRFSLLSMLSVLPLLSLAFPTPLENAEVESAPALIDRAAKYSKFYLQTSLVKADKSKAKFDKLYVWAYHTGAGFNDAVATSNKTYAVKFYINTAANHSLSADLGTKYPWGFTMQQTPYAQWSPVEIDTGNGDPGFSINKVKGVVWGTTGCKDAGACAGSEFGGWLICDWWHGVPQLFWRYNYYNISDSPALSSCADVYLKPITVK